MTKPVKDEYELLSNVDDEIQVINLIDQVINRHLLQSEGYGLPENVPAKIRRINAYVTSKLEDIASDLE